MACDSASTFHSSGGPRSPGAIERAAKHAEALGYDDVWVSDHLVIPEGQSYPAPHLCDPLMSLAFAAAVDRHRRSRHERARRPAVHEPARARELAGEPRLPERRTAHGRHRHRLVGEGVRSVARAVRPPRRASRRDDRPVPRRVARRPRDARWALVLVHRHPRTTAACARRADLDRRCRATPRSRARSPRPTATTASASSPSRRPRSSSGSAAGRPDDDFTISLRVPWDARSHEPDEIKAQREAYAAAGIQHLMAAPTRGSIDAWLEGMETIATALGLTPR